jgi:hypothetical protein
MPPDGQEKHGERFSRRSGVLTHILSGKFTGIPIELTTNRLHRLMLFGTFIHAASDCLNSLLNREKTLYKYSLSARKLSYNKKDHEEADSRIQQSSLTKSASHLQSKRNLPS